MLARKEIDRQLRDQRAAALKKSSTTWAGWAEASRRPMFVRKAPACEICGTRRALLFAPAKRERGRAGMNCPEVPAGVTAKVRLDTNVTLTGDEALSDVAVSGLISRRRRSRSGRARENFCRRSFRATVAPDSTCRKVCCAERVASVADGVKVSW